MNCLSRLSIYLYPPIPQYNYYSHGAASFTEIAQIVASNWKSIDDETNTFVTTVSSLLKKYIVDHGLEGEKKTKKKTKKKSSNKRQSSSPTNPHEISEESLNHMMVLQSSPLLHTDIESHIDTLQNNPLISFSQSATPIVNNLSSADMVLSHNDVVGGQYDLCQPITQASAPVAPSQQQIIPNITGSDDNIVNSTEQSFLSHIFSSNTSGESGEGVDGSAQEAPTNLQQQQTVTDLLAQMSGTSSSNPRPRASRRASMPDMRRIASLEAELERRRGELHGGSSNKRQRRASTMGSPPYKEGMKEVDMSNEEIIQIWNRASSPGPFTPNGRNRAA